MVPRVTPPAGEDGWRGHSRARTVAIEAGWKHTVPSSTPVPAQLDPAAHLATVTVPATTAGGDGTISIQVPQRCDVLVQWGVDGDGQGGGTLASGRGAQVQVDVTGKLEGDCMIDMSSTTATRPSSGGSVRLEKVRGDVVHVITTPSPPTPPAAPTDEADGASADAHGIGVTEVVECRTLLLRGSVVSGKKALVDSLAVVEGTGEPQSGAPGAIRLQGLYTRAGQLTTWSGHGGGGGGGGDEGGGIHIDTLHGSAWCQCCDSHDAMPDPGMSAPRPFSPVFSVAQPARVDVGVTGCMVALNHTCDGTIRVHFDEIKHSSACIAHGDITISLAPPVAVDLVILAAAGVIVSPGLSGLFAEGMVTPPQQQGCQAALAALLSTLAPSPAAAQQVMTSLHHADTVDTGVPGWVGGGTASGAWALPWRVQGRFAAVGDMVVPPAPEERVQDPAYRAHEMVGGSDGGRTPSSRGAASSAATRQSGKVSTTAPVTGFYDTSSQRGGSSDGSRVATGVAGLTRLMDVAATPAPTLFLISTHGLVKVQAMTWMERVAQKAAMAGPAPRSHLP